MQSTQVPGGHPQITDSSEISQCPMSGKTVARQGLSQTSTSDTVKQRLSQTAARQKFSRTPTLDMVKQKVNQVEQSLFWGFILGMAVVGASKYRRKSTSFSIIAGMISAIFYTGGNLWRLNNKDKAIRQAWLQSPERKTPEDTGLFGPHTEIWQQSWQAFLALHGSAAGIFQNGRPEVNNRIESSRMVYTKFWSRIEETALADKTFVYGDRRHAEAAKRFLFKIHTRVKAIDPELLLWVHNSGVWVFLQIIRNFGKESFGEIILRALGLDKGRPGLSPEKEDQLVRELHVSAGLVGIKFSEQGDGTKQLVNVKYETRPDGSGRFVSFPDGAAEQENQSCVNLPNNVEELEDYMRKMFASKEGDQYVLRETKGSRHYQNLIINGVDTEAKEGEQHKVASAGNFLIDWILRRLAGASLHIFTPEQRERFAIPTSRFENFNVIFAKVLLKIIQAGAPSIDEIRLKLMDDSFRDPEEDVSHEAVRMRA